MSSALHRSLLCIALLAAALAASAETVISTTPHGQQWQKRGVIAAPGFAGPQSSAFVSAPSVIRLENGRLRMYVWVADGTPPWLNGRHVIVAAEADPADPFKWELVGAQPMVGPEPGSAKRDRGAGFPFVLPRSDGPWLMYFGTWGGDWQATQQLANRTGLALSHDQGLTWEVVDEDVLASGPPGSFDAGAIPSVGIVRNAPDDYLLWYTAAEKYVRFGPVNQGLLHIGGARSRDGIHWQDFAEPVLRARVDAADPYEACLARPAVIKLDGVYHMWLGVYDMAAGNRPSTGQRELDGSREALIREASGSYRLEYARSTDGIHWTRFADQPVIPLTPGGFDATSQTYASVVDMGDELWLFYTGDGLGNTGVGLATLDKAQLSAN
jgi:predicted GH43/DUF377 family glycosyl hydrolase